jgi:hypothetical protein
MAIRKAFSGLLALSVAVAISASSGEADASALTCSVTQLAWATGSSGTLQVYCGGAWYYAFGSSGSCPTANIDARKAWQSLAQAAMLSGKSLYIDYTSCSGGPGINYLRMQ